LALDILFRTIWGAADTRVETIRQMITFLISQLDNQFYMIPIWKYIPTPTNLKVERTFKELEKVMLEIIQKKRKERQEHPSEVRTLLDMFIDARDEGQTSNTSLSDTEVKISH
jgi:cytochrome P450